VFGIDTAVVVRLLTRDDPAEASRAAAFIDAHEVLVHDTVLLETERVLRSVYGCDREAVLGGLRELLHISTLRVRDREAVDRALSWYGEGMDFADALHIATARTSHFATFDRKLARKARRTRGAPAVTLV
jgi:predicted nucleic-acid-binding protein